jgi:sulfonate transport system substrate-binding protein
MCKAGVTAEAQSSYQCVSKEGNPPTATLMREDFWLRKQPGRDWIIDNITGSGAESLTLGKRETGVRNTVSGVVVVVWVVCAAAQGDRPLRLAVNTTTIESAPLFMLAEEPANSSFRLSSGGIPLLVSREADAATNSSTQAVLRSVAAPNLRIVLTVAECVYHIVARRSAGIERVSDLRGKRVGVPLNTSAHFYLAQRLRQARLTESDVTLVALAQADMAGAIAKGDVDAVSIWEPWAHNSSEALAADAVVLEDRSLYRELFNLNTTSDVLADREKRAALVALVRGTIRSSRQLESGPAIVAPLLASKINVKVDTTTTVWNEFRFPASLPSDLLDVLAEEEAWLAAAQKRAARSRTILAALIDGSVLAEALK